MWQMVMIDHVPQTAVAKLYGVHKSTISRACDRVSELFREVMARMPSVAECMELILRASVSVRRSFAQQFSQALREQPR